MKSHLQCMTTLAILAGSSSIDYIQHNCLLLSCSVYFHTRTCCETMILATTLSDIFPLATN